MPWILYLVIGFVTLLLLTQYLAMKRAKASEGQPAPNTEAVDGEAHGAERRVYYFFATHCGPCRAMTPIVDRLQAAHRNLIKINVAETPELARDFGIAATPSFIVVENDVVRQVKLGGQSERQLLHLLQSE
jgi:thioredoxin 1